MSNYSNLLILILDGKRWHYPPSLNSLFLADLQNHDGICINFIADNIRRPVGLIPFFSAYIALVLIRGEIILAMISFVYFSVYKNTNLCGNFQQYLLIYLFIYLLQQ